MSVKLEYRHQQKTYDLMNQGFENHKKVAYILQKNMLIKATQKQYMIKIGIFLINK